MNEAAKRIVERFEMQAHPEGGYFTEVYRSEVELQHPAIPQNQTTYRSGGTFIYYLLAGEDFSAFHRLRWTDELWHLYAGGPLELHVIDAMDSYSIRLLTTNLEQGEPTAVVEAGCWQAARLAAGADWFFGGCTVAPGFEYADFEIPLAEELLENHAAHAEIIAQLTRK